MTKINEPAGLGRRSFLRGGATLAAGAGLQALLTRHAEGAPTRAAFSPDYGPLGPVNDLHTGLPLLHLPQGFRYRSLGWTGDPLADGTPTPGAHDGMAVVRTLGRLAILVRNHEQGGVAASFAASGITYDSLAPGGTTNLLVDLKTGELLRAWASLSGTVRNCAGGPTPWGSWLTCEENLDDTVQGYGKPHGWVFDVPALGDADPVPLKGMGRFNHEANAVDPRSGIIYETEDKSPCGFYRYIDETILERGSHRFPGRLLHGLFERLMNHGHRTFKLSGTGILQMLRVKGTPNQNLGGTFPVGTSFNTEWVTIDDPEKAHFSGLDGLGVFRQGEAKGGALFKRLEGCWYHRGKIYVVSTSGGAVSQGQVWVYDPVDETIELLFESPSNAVLNSPDNIAVSPGGGIVLCEDGNVAPQRLRGLTQDGLIYEFARNNVILPAAINEIPAGSYIGSEWAGATFSPDGKWLFVNIQTPGITFAITGPWHKGGL